MRFFDRVSLNQKLGNVSKRRNEIFMKQMNNVHPFFSVMGLYLGSFYQAISDDPNTKEFLKAFAAADEQRIDLVNRFLVFWFFWSMDRLGGHNLMTDQKILHGLKEIWSFNDSGSGNDRDLSEFIEKFDSVPQETTTVFLWEMVKKAVGEESLPILFANIHLRNAQMNLISGQFFSDLEKNYGRQ